MRTQSPCPLARMLRSDQREWASLRVFETRRLEQEMMLVDSLQRFLAFILFYNQPINLYILYLDFLI